MVTRRNPLWTTHRKVIKERQTSRLLGFKEVELPETDRKVSEGRFLNLFNVQGYLQNCVPPRQQFDKTFASDEDTLRKKFPYTLGGKVEEERKVCVTWVVT